MKKKDRLYEVRDVSIFCSDGFNHYVRLWVDDCRFFAYAIEGDKALAWVDDKIPFLEKDFQAAYNMINPSQALHYHVSFLKIYHTQMDIDAGYRLKHDKNRKMKKFVDGVAIKDVIELWFYLQKKKPLLIEKSLLATEKDSILKQFPGLALWQLEELHRSLGEHINNLKMGIDTHEAVDSIKESAYSMSKIKTYSEKECNKYLHSLLLKGNYEDAADLRDFMKGKEFKIYEK